MNKYVLKGKKAKELLNLGQSNNPYLQNTREHYLWNLGNRIGVYVDERYEDVVLYEHNSEIIMNYGYSEDGLRSVDESEQFRTKR